VEVDSENGMVKVTRVWPAMSCGKTINPTGARQQIVGGFVQGVGLTLMEEVKFKDGLLQNPNFVDYMAPRSEESPTFEEPTFIEIPHPYGSLGGKGLGEMGIIVAPASIANAVAHAIGRGVNELPLTPERVHSAIAQSSVHHG
jgi:CO/xanthine dehydrogenase Mo-binding subunit